MTKIEYVWYYVFMLTACALGSTLIVSFADKSYSMVLCIVWGVLLGIYWNKIWKHTLAKLMGGSKDD